MDSSAAISQQIQSDEESSQSGHLSKEELGKENEQPQSSDDEDDEEIDINEIMNQKDTSSEEEEEEEEEDDKEEDKVDNEEDIKSETQEDKKETSFEDEKEEQEEVKKVVDEKVLEESKEGKKEEDLEFQDGHEQVAEDPKKESIKSEQLPEGDCQQMTPEAQQVKGRLSIESQASQEFASQLFADMERSKLAQKRMSDDFAEQQSSSHHNQNSEIVDPTAALSSLSGDVQATKSEQVEGGFKKIQESAESDDQDGSSEKQDNEANDEQQLQKNPILNPSADPTKPSALAAQHVLLDSAKTKNKDSDSDEDEDDDDDDDEDVDLDDDDESLSALSAGAKQKLLDEEMKKDDNEDEDDSDDDDSDDDSDDNDIGSNKDSDSLLEEDIANRSLNGEDEDQLVVIDNMNYLKYVSDRFSEKTDILEIVDKNERSFKQLAEKMIVQTSYLVQQQSADDDSSQTQSSSIVGPTARRLMHFKTLPSISQTFHSSQSKNGFPYAISAIDLYIGVGSSDGGVRVFDQHERELKLLQDKSVKGIPIMSLDMIRMRESSIYVVAGHQKGQISLYEVKGLRTTPEPFGMIQSKHLKTVTDIHEHPVISIKFFGDLSYTQKKISVVSCDLDGVIYLSYYKEGLIGYQCVKQCFMKKRLGPTFSIAPFLVVTEVNPDEIEAIVPHQMEELQHKSNQTQLVSFGSLSRILIAQITPQAKELLIIDKPDYIEMGTVPYLDWGYGLSPCCRDKSYPMLAIAWGRILQLALYTNFQKNAGGKQEETPQLQYDGFYICESSIDSCFFLTESILFVLVNKKEVRILYTQNFTPGLFDETYQLNDLTGRQNYNPSVKFNTQQDRKVYFNTLKEKFVGQVSTYAEKDKGYRLLQNDEIKFKDNPYTGNNVQQRSNYNYNPTICKNKDNLIVALGKSSIGQGQLLHWEEYLDLIRKTNQESDQWLMVLRAALDIFNGKMIGLAGIPDHKETREQMLRDEMKDLLRENIDSCIKEFQEGACVSTKTLRVALEFCIRVNAIDHLFGELFLMFAEAGMEQRFFENLEAFILAGKFKQTKIPKKILVRLIEYYRQKDVELLEKILLNLNLSKYRNILEVRHICESEFLTSALIHILTNLFDNDNENTVCLQLLCCLYNMMQKTQVKIEQQDVFKLITYDYQYQPPGSVLAEVKAPSEVGLSKKEKMEIEHSQTYIGYKLMWVMKMFLEGKKFPQGTLSAFKWRIYVYDIVRFATNQQFLSWFLAFDPDCFFKLMKTVFLDPEPYEYIQSQKDFIEMYRDQINGLDACMTHTQIIDALQQQVISYIARDRDQNNGFLSQKGECALNSFIFFVSQISRKPQVPVPVQLGAFVVREHLKFYRKLMKIPEITSEALNKLATMPGLQVPLWQVQGNKKNAKQAAKQDKLTRLYLALIKKNERDVISLLQRCEEELEDEEIVALWHDAERSPMFKVRVYLLQLQGNHRDCLEMYFKLPAIREDVFIWLNDIESRMQHDDANHNIKEGINSLILNYFPRLVDMDPSQSIKLVEQWFMEYDSNYDHLVIVDERLKNDPDLTFKYLSTYLADKENIIQEEHQKLLMSGMGAGGGLANDSSHEFARYKQLMNRFVKVLLSSIGEKKYRGMLSEFVKKKYAPLEESYQIISEYKQNLELQSERKSKGTPKEREINEALAILCRRSGESEKAIDLYIQVLIDLSHAEVKLAIYLSKGEVPYNDAAACNSNQHIMKFDALVGDIVKLCDKVGGSEADQESLWLHAIRSLYKVKSVLFDDIIRQNTVGASGQQKENKDYKNFSTFHMIRVQYFMRKMSEHVSLPKIIQFLEDINTSGNPIKYQDCRTIFEDKMRTEMHHENILINAATLLLKDLNADFSILKLLHSRGIRNEKERCDHCKRTLLSRWDPQSVCSFSCGHIYHQRCAQNNGNKCGICLNEYEEIQQIINQRGVRRIAGGGSKTNRGGAGERGESPEDRRSGSRTRSTRDSQASAAGAKSAQVNVVPKKTMEIEKEQKSSFMDFFQMQMVRYEAEINDRILKLEYF